MAAARIEFELAIGPDQFAEIAKLRAFRRIWARVLEASGVEPDLRRSPTLGRTSGRMWSAIDPWVNMLRGTTATFAAAVAGADGMTVAPFDAEIGVPGQLGRRMARNTQLVLMNESSLAKVADPGGGSWYVESLTDELAGLGWERFTAIEAEGGIVAALESGSIADQLAEAAGQRHDEIDRRERELTGVNTFPLLGDDGTEPIEPPDAEALAAAEAERLSADGEDADGGTREAASLIELRDMALEGTRIDQLVARIGLEPRTSRPLPQTRDAAPFEDLRRQSGGGSGREPARIFLAAVGPLAQHNSVATWAKNFFESGGIETAPSGERDDSAALAQAFADSGLRVAAVCANPKAEPEELRDVVDGLRRAGAAEVYLAMRSGEDADAAGADLGVRDGTPMLQTLTKVAAAARGELEVEPA
ncbi:MAG: methylmalonyl-CoA mutase family protein [Solirubrobacterales bacterium]